MPKKMQLESKVTEEVVKYLKKKGCEIACFNSNNWPDRLVVPRNAPMFFIEFKRSTEGNYGATDGQLDKMQKIKERGHTAILIYGNLSWKKTIDKLLNNKVKIEKKTEEKTMGLDI